MTSSDVRDGKVVAMTQLPSRPKAGTLVQRIRQWEEDESAGYDHADHRADAIELLSEAAAALAEATTRAADMEAEVHRVREQALREELARRQRLFNAAIQEAIDGLKYAQDWKRIERLEAMEMEAAEEHRYAERDRDIKRRGS
jgi:hypothetical protein